MAESNKPPPSNEDQSLTEEQQKSHRSGARPRNQNYSGNRGRPQYRNRTFHNLQRPVDGSYQQVDHFEEPSLTASQTSSNSHERGYKHRPFKYNKFGRHQKHQDNSLVKNPNASCTNDYGDTTPSAPPYEALEDFSTLSVSNHKQSSYENSNDGDRPAKGQYQHENRPKQGGYRNRRGYQGRRHNQRDDLSLLSGVAEKQNWSNNNNDEYDQNLKGNHEKGQYKSLNTNYDHRDHNPKPDYNQKGEGNVRSNKEPRGEYEQFKWYGRRNYNSFGKQGTFRPYEEQGSYSVKDHYYRNDYSHRGQYRHERSSGPQNAERRQHSHHYQKSKASGRNHVEAEDDGTQRERLLQQLKEGELECMVCCESVRHRDPIWSCINCYHIFHLHCIKKWARSPTAVVEGSGWRCPTCQTIKEEMPNQYYCYCGKVVDPERSYHDTPHSCGNTCGRKQTTEDCNHPCVLLCHPGPCPPCSALVTSTCPCGRVTVQIRCGKSKTLTCDETCEKDLNCGVHKCEEKCHTGPCQPCSAIVKQECYCSKVSRDTACTETTSKTAKYSCGQECKKLLGCGEHHCDNMCHDGACFSCRLLPENVTHCPCGRTKVTDLLHGENRKTCTEPIPTCNGTCLKMLQCGPEDDPHSCQAYCHAGACPPCPLKTSLRCHCGATSREFFCTELNENFQFLCEKRCNKKRRCGRHKCLNTCCVDYEHLCLQVCNQKLTCGLHNCQELCHIGNCKPCLNASFEELTCRCGHSVRYPPVPCGAKPPECDQTCTREHPCEHPPQHNCHSEEVCPPCTVLSEKWCYGGHEKRSHLPCFLSSLSCGLPCQKPLSCGQHKCQQICHEGQCEGEIKSCTQKCLTKRTDCEHPCGAPCHPGKPCPETSCKQLISMSCICGIRTEKLPCSENSRLFRQMSASLLASKMQDIQSGASVDISDVLGSQKKNKLNRLECNEECSLVERNRRLALALQIRNPDLSSKPGPPSYTEFLKDETRKNPTFVKSIHDKLTDLVQLAKQSKQKSRSNSFPPMNREQRRVIHELADYFGCETSSFDQEPKRNVVVTALRDRSYLPSSSVMSMVQREMGQRKAPPPMIHSLKDKPTSSSKEPIDHFDFPQ